MNNRNSEQHSQASSCPICGTQAAIRDSHVSPHNAIRYLVHHCPECSLEFWTPREVDLTIYKDDGFEAYRDYHSGTRPFPRWASPLFTRLPGDISSALDIGCGDGAVLERLQKAGIEVRGIDLDEESVRVANGKCGGGKCSVSTLDRFAAECRGRGDAFDLVTFFEVLEHQTHPDKFLAEVKALVRPGARVAGSVPNRRRFLAQIDRKFGDGDHPPHHFLWFSSQSLHNILWLSGFVDIEIAKVESTTYGELRDKLKKMLRRRMTLEQGKTAAIAYGSILAVAPVVAAFLHLGRRLKPSHLFFRCRRQDKNTGDRPATDRSIGQ